MSRFNYGISNEQDLQDIENFFAVFTNQNGSFSINVSDCDKVSHVNFILPHQIEQTTPCLNYTSLTDLNLMNVHTYRKDKIIIIVEANNNARLPYTTRTVDEEDSPNTSESQLSNNQMYRIVEANYNARLHYTTITVDEEDSSNIPESQVSNYQMNQTVPPVYYEARDEVF